MTLAGLALIVVKPVIAGLLLLVSVIVFTTHYRMELDFSKMQYQDFVWILGLRRGESKPFAGIEYLFAKRIKVSQTMSVRVASTTIQKDQFDGYIKFGDDHKVHLLTSDSRNRLLKRLEEIASKLDTKVVDQSQPVTF
jgi:hypothetical protein